MKVIQPDQTFHLRLEEEINETREKRAQLRTVWPRKMVLLRGMLSINKKRGLVGYKDSIFKLFKQERQKLVGRVGGAGA